MSELRVMADLHDRVRRYMEAHAMLSEGGGRVLAACSGGADSVALLFLLREMEDVETVCAHYNHCLRGEESDRDEAFVRRLCADWGIPFRAGRGDVAAFAAVRGMNLEEAAREKRYDFLRETARAEGCERIATAHTASDNAETVLFHLIRGAGTLGLCGIPPVRGMLIRPLLCLSREEIESLLRENGLEHVEDSTNADTRYARNDLRKNVLPALERINAGALRHINAAAELLREDEDYLDGLAERLLAEHCADGALAVGPLLSAPRPVAMRALRRFARSPGRAHLERLYAFCAGGRERAALDLPGGRAVRENGLLRFGAAPPVPPAEERRELREGETLLLARAGKLVRCERAECPQEIHNSFNTFYFKSENICDKLYVAPRTAGDRIRLKGRGCTKTLKQLFSEARLPLEERQRRLVISDALGPVAVEGFGTAERCAAEAGASAIRVEIKKSED